MPKTRLISPGIANHSLKKNLVLDDNYISNDGGDEGISIDNAGDVGINIPTTITPLTKLEVFNSNVQYSTGTAYQSGNGIAGSGTTFTDAMVGSRFVFDDGTDAGIITSFVLSNVLTVSTSQTVGASDDLRAYKIYYPSMQIDTAADGTTLKIGNTSFNTSSGDILLAAQGGGNILMTDGTNNIFDFNVNTPSLVIRDDADSGDKFTIAVGDNGSTLITTIDNDGADAALEIDVDGYLLYQATFLQLLAHTRTASTTSDSTFVCTETLNLSSGAGGSDIHYGFKYIQTQTNLAGWNTVYLMYLHGGDAARTFAVQGDGKVGIGVADPDTALEILTTSNQLKLSYDADSYATIGVGSGSTASITAAESGNVQLYGSSIVFGNNAGGNHTGFSLTANGSTWTSSDADGTKIDATNDAASDFEVEVTRNALIDAGGSITLDSANGTFIMKGAGSIAEFSVANSAFAGMILGYTTDGIDAADDSYVLSTSFTVTDSAHKVKFVAPPSGVVEIFVSIFADTSRRFIHFGLSDNATYNTLDVTHEHEVYVPGGTLDELQINHYWVITGLTAGTAYEYWLGAKIASGLGGALRWGGNVTGEWPPFIMKATALPTAVADYAVYG